MCDPPSSSKGSVGAAVVLGIGGVSVVAYAVHPSAAAAKPTPVQTAPAVSPGIPWLTISTTVLATAAVGALILVAVRAWRRRRKQAPVMQVPQQALTQRPEQRALSAREPARAWLDKTKA